MYAPMKTTTAIFLVLYAAVSLSSPAPNPGAVTNLLQATPPSIAPGFTKATELRIKQALKDACALAVQAVIEVYPIIYSGPNNPIFNRYFPESVSSDVEKVFEAIIGQDAVDCSEKLASMTISVDFRSGPENKFGCKSDGDFEDVMAYLHKSSEDHPILVLCKPGLAHGGLTDVHGGPEGVKCKDLGKRTTYRMDTLGSIILHEYFHWEKLVMPPIDKPIRDSLPDGGEDVYGVVEVQNAAVAGETVSKYIADSYTWFALDAYWTKKCGNGFEKAIKFDDGDPACDGRTCKDKVSPDT